MAHCAKYSKSATGHMLNHYGRSELEESAYVKRSNENINPEKTNFNYNLAKNDQPLEQLEFIHKRLSQVRVLNRKDVNIMADWIVTIPKGLLGTNEKKFFEETYKFLINRYGKENVISAFVHMDETTPHMHYAFLPITADRKKGGFKLSAKEVINLKDLQTFHNDLSRYHEAVFGHDIGILNGATKEGNKSIAELKRKSAIERKRELVKDMSKIFHETEKEIQSMKNSLKIMQTEYEAKKAYVTACNKSCVVSTSLPSYAEVKEKGIFTKQKFVTVPYEKWIEKCVSADEQLYLKNAVSKFELSIEGLKRSLSSVRQLEEKNKELEEDLIELCRENFELNAENKDLKNEFDKFEKNLDLAFDQFPSKLRDSFFEILEKIVLENQQEWDLEI